MVEYQLLSSSFKIRCYNISIRKVENMQKRIKGVVTRKELKFGFIQGDDGHSYFLANKNMKNAVFSGDRVSFVAYVERKKDNRKKKVSRVALDIEKVNA
jgi:exoribonuclease II